LSGWVRRASWREKTDYDPVALRKKTNLLVRDFDFFERRGLE
jgi:hypothetical protein